jgi:integrase
MAGKRRGRGEGSVYFDEARQLWVSQVSLGKDPVSGKRRRETVYGATKKEVQDKLLDLQQKAADGRLDQTDMSVKTFLEFWLGRIKTRVRRTSYAKYENQVNNYLIPFLGKLKLVDLTAFDVAQLHRKHEEAGFSASKRHLAAVRLRQALRTAVRFGLLSTSPAERVDLPRYAPQAVRPMGPGELAAFLHAAEADRYYPLFVLAVDSGARISELLALGWDDLDETRAELRICKSLEWRRGEREAKEPKTAAGRRRVVLSPTTLAVLRRHREAMGREGHGERIMFPSTTGGHS